MRWILVAAGTALLAACESAESKRVSAAQEAVAQLLKDPSAAQFRDVRDGTPGYVCGEVNGKNSYGAYIGFRRFLVDTSGAVIESEDMPFSVEMWGVACDTLRFPTVATRDSFVLVTNARIRDSIKAADRYDIFERQANQYWYARRYERGEDAAEKLTDSLKAIARRGGSPMMAWRSRKLAFSVTCGWTSIPSREAKVYTDSLSAIADGLRFAEGEDCREVRP